MKIPDLGFPQGTHPTTYEFYGWTRSVLNEGRYQMRILNSAPTWVANDGEVVLVQTGTERALYAYITDGWYNLNWDTSGAVRGVPTGTILIFAGPESSLPAGYALCNGAAASRTTYAILYSAIGTTYGVGDGTSTFALPDLRQRFPVGAYTDGTYNLGQTGGSPYLQTHTHWITFYAASAAGGSGSGQGVNTQSNTYYGFYSSAPDVSTGDTGNIPPFLALNFIIKL
jgi:microcystin-dependent protein